MFNTKQFEFLCKIVILLIVPDPLVLDSTFKVLLVPIDILLELIVFFA